MRLLEGLQEDGFISKEVAKTLVAAYCTYRDVGHKRVLQGENIVINEAEVAGLSRQVELIWHKVMG